MTVTATHSLGKFVWRELWTSDVEAAKRFYGELFGWTWSTMPMGDGGTYTMANLGEKSVCGVMDVAHAPGVPPHWSLYVTVDDVDAAAARAQAAGGTLLTEPTDIPDIGRFVAIQDPQGAVLNLYRSVDGDGEDTPPGASEFSWEHLNTSDPAAGIAFYTQVVGWGSQDFGPMAFFNRDGGKTPVAVVSQVPAGMPPHWLTYVTVTDLDATVAKAQALGGTAIELRIDVPGTGAYALLKDPAGVLFMLAEPAQPSA